MRYAEWKIKKPKYQSQNKNEFCLLDEASDKRERETKLYPKSHAYNLTDYNNHLSTILKHPFVVVGTIVAVMLQMHSNIFFRLFFFDFGFRSFAHLHLRLCIQTLVER